MRVPWQPEAMIRRSLTALSALLLSLPLAAAADDGIAGKWRCDYTVRKLSSAQQSSSAWFEVTLTEAGRFHGGGKAVAAGSALPMALKGAWALDEEGVLKLTGISDVANRQVPFRFVSDRVGPDRFKRAEMKGASEYRTSCRRD